MIERGDHLQTWRLSSLPVDRRPVDAEPLHDHRKIYLDYEGPISDGRGVVTRYDHGCCEIQNDSPERLAVRLTGAKLDGVAVLVKVSQARWLLSFEAAHGETVLTTR